MKKLLCLTISCLLAILLLFTACSEKDPIYNPVSEETTHPTVTIILDEEPDADKVKVTITPSQYADKVEYAIGKSTDKDKFNDGSLSRRTSDNNEPVTDTFDSLDSGASYMIFARALRTVGEQDIAGPTTTHLIHTFNGELAITQNFVGVESMAFNIQAIPTYVNVEYMLATDANKATIDYFESTETDPEERGKIVEKYVSRETFSATFFDLLPNTTYYFLVRGEDRLGNRTKTFVYEATTYSKTEAPYVEASMDFNSFWLTGITFTPNDATKKYYLNFVGAGALNGFYMSMAMYCGDYKLYLSRSAANDPNNIYNSIEAEMPFVNGEFDLDAEYEVFILVFDHDDNPVSVQRFYWQLPGLNHETGTAKVEINVEPTNKGGKYTFTPNEHTVAFVCETFTAELIDGNDPVNPGAKDEEWIRNFLTNRLYGYSMSAGGTQWHYKYFAPYYWTGTWEDDSADDATYPSGTELEIIVMPMNENGLLGIGELTRKRYAKL